MTDANTLTLLSLLLPYTFQKGNHYERRPAKTYLVATSAQFINAPF